VAEAAYLVNGKDPLLRDRVVDELVTELLGDDDRVLALEELTVPPARRGGGDTGGGGAGSEGEDGPTTGAVAAVGAEGREAVVGAAVNAASSPPFMTARRVVVLRDVGALSAGDVTPLVQYLDAPLDTSAVVFVSGGGTTPAALAKKLKEVGAPERSPDSEATDKVLLAAARDAEIDLRPDAARAVARHLGEDAGRVESLVEILHAAYGDDAIDVDDVAPYLGEVGSVPIFRLTNAVEEADGAAALEVLHRLFAANDLHALQVIGSLLAYFRRLLRLDDPEIRSVGDAIEALGGRVKEFPARKALEASRALGTDGIRRAFDAFYQADLDIKGARGIPPETVIEVLVVRLARLMPTGGRRPARR
jgi:DNA polymerase-3 subunit delta